MERINWRNFDFVLFGIAAALTIVGATMINTSIAGNIELIETNIVQRQLIFAAAGFLAALILAFVDYHLWASISRTMYIISVLVLMVLWLVGVATFGAARWFDVGLFNIQPSEIAKFVMILVLADFFAKNQGKLHDLGWILRSIALTLGVVIWILLQPNLSTSIVIFVIWFALIFVSGLPLKYLVYGALLGLLAAAIIIPLLFNPNVVNEGGLIKPYQVQRITNFLFPDEEASYGETYNVDQAVISIASGGVFGKGYGQGTQTQLRFLKVRHTDFIFSVLAEEFGMAGVALVLVLLFLLILRCLRAARLARDTFGGLIAYGVATQITFQAMINIGMNLNLLPVSGLPLPFLSYGGSSLLSILMGLGLVESVILRHKSLDF